VSLRLGNALAGAGGCPVHVPDYRDAGRNSSPTTAYARTETPSAGAIEPRPPLTIAASKNSYLLRSVLMYVSGTLPAAQHAAKRTFREHGSPGQPANIARS
jgi:hypothetical protein